MRVKLPRCEAAAGILPSGRSAAVSAHDVSEKSQRDAVGKHRGSLTRSLHRTGERLRQAIHDRIAGAEIRSVKSFHPGDSCFVGHLIKRDLRDAKADRIELGIQTDNRTVAEINELRVTETPIGHFPAPSGRP